MGAFQKFVEKATDAKYVAPGKKCDICGERLSFLETGFWSINATPLRDGVICKHCYEKLEQLRKYRKLWVPETLQKAIPFCYLEGDRLFLMDVQKAKQLLESAGNLAEEELTSIGSSFGSVFRMAEACFIEPTALQVGIQRARELHGKLVLFGFVQHGQFEKNDRVLIIDGEKKREAVILEAYAFDCEENTLEVNLKAHMGKQLLDQWQSGWLILDDTDTVSVYATVVG